MNTIPPQRPVTSYSAPVNRSDKEAPAAKYMSAEPQQKMLAAKMPSSRQTKQAMSKIKQWLNDYMNRPHKYDPDKIRDNANLVFDILTDKPHKTDTNKA